MDAPSYVPGREWVRIGVQGEGWACFVGFLLHRLEDAANQIPNGSMQLALDRKSFAPVQLPGSDATGPRPRGPLPTLSSPPLSARHPLLRRSRCLSPSQVSQSPEEPPPTPQYPAGKESPPPGQSAPAFYRPMGPLANGKRGSQRGRGGGGGGAGEIWRRGSNTF